MKKIFSTSILLTLLLSSHTYGLTEHNIQSANFIASKGIINDNAVDITKYNLNNNITRREMLKVMMNLSGKNVVDSCAWKFNDISPDDWGCKYAEAALEQWYIAANAKFRPDDNVTQIESLKMIMQAKWIERNEAEDWRDWYITKAQSEGIIEETFLDYDKLGIRWWIFSNAARSYSDFSYTAPQNVELTPEEEELWELLGL